MATRPRRIDALVRALPRTDDEIQHRMPKPFRGVPLGDLFGQRYVPPISDTHASAGADRTEFGDPSRVRDRLFSDGRLDAAILICPNRLLRADRRHEEAVMRATNEWLADTWLEPATGGRFWGSIYISPSNVAASVEEIERWAPDPRFVQIAVPLHVHMPYGEEEYFPIWEAAAAHDLPVAIHGDGSGGVEYDGTIAGAPPHFLEYHTLFPVNAMVHLSSLISEGVFDRLPRLRFVFTDGAAGVLVPFLWREDAKLKALKEETPWVERAPSHTIGAQVRFVLRRDDIPNDVVGLDRLLKLSRVESALLYGSNFPMWDLVRSDELSGAGSALARIEGQNALETYTRLGQTLAGQSAG